MYILPKFIPSEKNETRQSTASNENIVDLAEKKLPDEEPLAKSDEKADSEKQNLIDLEEMNNLSSFSKFSNSISDISEKNQRKTDANYLLKNIISKEVSKIKNETDNLSNLLMERIEAANIEGLIDKTVSGIVELKDDLMRMNEPEGLRKRTFTAGEASVAKATDGVDAFLKKEIDAIKEANVIPTVLSNGHAK